jgi:hypothetical protein
VNDHTQIRCRTTLTAGLSAALFFPLWVEAQSPVPAQAVTVEPKTTLLPGGPEQRPFDVTRHTIPLSDIEPGGPARDGIPAILHPRFVTPGEASAFVKTEDRVLGVFLDGQAKAYPVQILNYHELVNDTLGKRPILVSWCPLCGSGVVYDARILGARRWFGVSGRLYKRNLLFYDRRTDSLWSQLLSQAVTGALAGTPIRPLSTEQTTWSAWRARHTDTLVLSPPATRFEYGKDPYAGYPLHRDTALLISAGAKRKIYPLSEIKRQIDAAGTSEVLDRIGGETITVVYDGRAQSAYVRSKYSTGSAERR